MIANHGMPPGTPPSDSRRIRVVSFVLRSGTDLGPVIAAIGRPQQHLRARVDRRLLSCGEMWSGVAHWKRYGSPCGAPRPDVRLVAELLIDARVAAVLPRGVEPAAVGRIDLREDAVVVADRHPVPHRHAAERPVRRPLPVLVILQAGVEVVRILHVDADRVDLADRNVRVVIARAAAVVRDRDAAVAAGDHAIGILADRSRACGSRRTCAETSPARSRSCRRRAIAGSRPASRGCACRCRDRRESG